MKVSYILCSKDREEYLRSLVHNLLEVDAIYDTEVIIIEASKDNRMTVSDLSIDWPSRIILKKTAAGLPQQRNEGLQLASGEVVVFLDDDVILKTSMYPELCKAFADSAVVGAAPLLEDELVTGEGFTWHNFFLRMGLKSGRAGRVTKSGVNSWLIDKPYSSNLFVEWLPGCAMAYRREAIKGLLFNEALTKGPLGGYALGEDVDFSLRAGKRGNLICVPTIRINHTKAPSIRDRELEMAEARGRWFAFLVRNHSEKVNAKCVYIRLMGAKLYHQSRSLFSLGMSRKRRLNLFDLSSLTLRCFVEELRRPTLI